MDHEKAVWRRKLARGAHSGSSVGILVGLSVLGAGLVGCSDTINDRDIVSIPLTEVRRLTGKHGNDALLLDSRIPSAYDRGHIPGAVNVPRSGVEAEKEKLPSQLSSPKYVIVYGDNPGDGYAAGITKRLLRAGQKGARLFRGGISEWTSAGLKLDGTGGAPSQP